MIVRSYTDFSGGKNTKQIPPIVVDAGDLQAFKWAETAKNWEMSEVGLIKAIGEADQLDTAISGTPIITGLFEYKNGTTTELIACANGKVFKVSGGTATQIYTGGTADKYYTHTEWDDGNGNTVLILVNGADAPLEYNGTTCAAITMTDPNTVWDGATPNTVEVFRGRVFYSDGEYIYTPRAGTYNNFDTATSDVDKFTVDGGFGGKITGLLSLTDNLFVIFKERAIRRLAGSAPFGSTTDGFFITNVSNNVGCIARRTITQAGKGLEVYFLSTDGLRKLEPVEKYGDVDPLMPTYPIQDEVNDWNYSAGVIDDACAVYVPKYNQVYLFVPDGSSAENNKTYTLDVVTGGIDPRGTDDFKVASMAVFGRKLYTGDYAGQVHKWGDDNGYSGENITAEWESKYIAHAQLSLLKAYRFITLYAEADGDGDVQVQWTILQDSDEVAEASTESINAGGNVWDSALFDTAVWQTGQTKVFHIKDIGKGHAIKFKFTNMSDSQKPKIRAVDIGMDVLGYARG